MDAFIGTILPWPVGQYVPMNWLPCNGQKLQVSRYAGLFYVIGNTYGGDGKVDFALPDMRSRVAIGKGMGPSNSNYDLGDKVGSETVILNSGNLPSHTHQATLGNTTLNSFTVKVSDAQATAHVPTSGTNTMGALYDVGNASAVSGYNSHMPDMKVNIGGGDASLSGSVTLAPSGGTSNAVSVVQPYVAMQFMICVDGVFPPRP